MNPLDAVTYLGMLASYGLSGGTRAAAESLMQGTVTRPRAVATDSVRVNAGAFRTQKGPVVADRPLVPTCSTRDQCRLSVFGKWNGALIIGLTCWPVSVVPKAAQPNWM